MPYLTEKECSKKQPDVSVVLPIYNAESYLSQALQSLINQTLSNIEILCVNDGSTDGSKSIIEQFAAKDSRVILDDGPNGGYGKAMNRGINRARGRYIAILEPDDYVLSHMFYKLVKTCDAYELDFVRSDFLRFYTDEKGWDCRTRQYICGCGSNLYNKLLNPQNDLSLFDVQMQNWTGIYKTDFIRSHNIQFHESPGARFQDNSFWFQTYCWATKIMYINRPFYCHRDDNPNSSTNRTDLLFAMLDEYAWIRSFLHEHSELEQKFIKVYQYEKFKNCNFAFSKLADELRPAYLERWSLENQQSMAAGEVDSSFFSKGDWEKYLFITNDPKGYLVHYREYRNKLENDKKISELKLKGGRALFSYYRTKLGVPKAARTTASYLINRSKK